MLDLVAQFAHGLPAWCDEQGKPLSWRHFRYGLSYLERHEIRDALHRAAAGRWARATKDDYDSWRQDMKMISD